MGRLSDDDIARLRSALTPERRPEPDSANWLDRAIHRRLIVHTTSDQSIEGTLTVVSEDGIVLCAAQLRAGPKPVDLGGEVFVPRDKVLLVQTVRT